MNWVSVKRVTLDVITLMCSSNVKDVSNTRPKCFCNETCWIGLLLKKSGGCTYNLFDLTSENSSLRLFRGVKIETYFSLESPFLYFVQIFTKLFSCCLQNIFGFDWRFSVRSLCRLKITEVRESKLVELQH